MARADHRHHPVVWVVDDYEPNLARFKSAHDHELGGPFEVRLFDRPEDVLAALQTATADALLCDIYYYSADEVEGAELEFQEASKNLELVATRIDAPHHADGVTLIEEVFRRSRGKPSFPVYAYTSKGPYLMESDGFDRLTHLGARWLFKGKVAPLVERVRIEADIEEARDLGMLSGWRRRFATYALQITVGSGLLGALVSVVIDRLLR